jgi:hypothetical protein
MTFGENHRIINPLSDPASTWDALFGHIDTKPDGIDVKAAKRQALARFVKHQLASIESRLRDTDSGPRAKLASHKNAMATLESRWGKLDSLKSLCTPPARRTFDLGDHSQFPSIASAQTDMLVAALACGTTRVASLQMAHTVGPLVMNWLGQSRTHHDISHLKNSDFVKSERWYAEQFAQLLDKLSHTADPKYGGTLLDHTLVVWAKEIGDANMHDGVDVPWILAGARQTIAPGRICDARGAAHNRLLVAICQAMGLTNDTFGSDSYGRGPLDGILYPSS